MTPTHLPLSPARFLALRLLPGEDLIAGLRAQMARHGLQAVWIAGAVGSLTHANLRYAAQPDGTLLEGAFEVIALGGTLDPECEHLHLSISDKQGLMRGGHVLPGCRVRTTLELVVGELEAYRFGRAPCPQSGYEELLITPRTL
ncbi:PCC domain-containing protein [Aeromonas veronii]|uniref:PCC domain-containing protein n=1 Tax=Aeromonas veronii TaxID=654 RepID=UPI0015E6F110|nr:DNA-binding protein [Aeromonas veronii]